MSRSTWKIPFSRVKPQREKLEQAARQLVWSRASTILPEQLGKQVCVHNGKTWIRLGTTEEMVGHRYGEFALTRKKTGHKAKRVKRK